MQCALCVAPEAETVLWRDARCRVIDVGDADYPGYCRVIWNAHVREMSDIPPDARDHLMTVVYAVEQALRAWLHPDKINLAALGNQMPHLHWHVIPRFADDPHFPDSIWSARKRTARAGGFDRDGFRRELAQHLVGEAS
jgi:diadenosine tetraphosphate (Ap4A) HIT family hydrolase